LSLDRRLLHRVADVVRDRAAGAVKSAVPDPALEVAIEVVCGSKVTVAVCATGFASTESTPGRPRKTCSTTFFSVAQLRPPVCTTTVAP
jgi:hypothetical protein